MSTPNPIPEKNVFHVGPDGRVVKAPRHLQLKTGWRVATELDVAAAAAAKVATDLKLAEAAAIAAAATAPPSPTPAKQGG